MADFNVVEFIQNIEAKILRLNGGKEEAVGKRNVLDQEAEISIFRGLVNSNGISRQDAQAVIDAKGIDYPDLDLGNTASAQRRAAANKEPDATFVFNNNINIYVNVDVDVQKAVDDALESLNFGALIETINNNQERMEQFLIALVNGFADSTKVELGDIKKILDQILAKIDHTDQDVQAMNVAVNKLLQQQLDVMKVMGFKLDKVIELCEANNEMQAEQNITLERQNEILSAIYDLLVDFNAEQKTQFNKVIALLEAGNINLNELVILAKAIKEKEAGDVTVNVDFDKLIEEMRKEGSLTREAINNVSLQINNLDESVRAGFEDVAAKIIANGGKLDDLKALLQAIKDDTGAIKLTAEETKDLSKEILEAIKALGTEFTANFGDLIAKFHAGSITLEELKEILKDIKGGVNEIKADVAESKEIQKQILAAIKVVGVDMVANFNKVIEAINNLNPNDAAKLEALFEKVLAAINNNTAVSVENKREIIEAMGKIKIEPGSVNIDLSALEQMVSELLEVAKNNKNILTSIDGKMDVVNLTIETAKNEIIAAIKNVPKCDCDTEINKILGKLDILIDKAGYNDEELLNLLNEILNKIKDHKVDVDVKCECHCNGGNPEEGKHEGIITEMNDMLNAEAKARRVAFVGFDDFDGATGVNSVTTEQKPVERWTTLNGIPLPGKPTQPGIYICNGKKIQVN